MASKQNALINYCLLALACLAGFFAVLYYSMDVLNGKAPTSHLVSTGWNIAINGESFTDVDISDFSFPVTQKGDRVVLTNTIPQSITLESMPILRFHVSYCTVNVFLNGENCYSYGQKELANNDNLGYGTHVVSLKDCKAGDALQIELHVTEPRAFSAFYPIFIVSAVTNFVPLLYDHAFILSCSLFFLVLGCAGTLGSVVFLLRKYKVRRFFAVSQVAFWLSMCALHHNGCIVFFSANYMINSYMEFISIYCATLAVTATLLTAQARTALEKRVLGAYFVAFALYAVTTLVLELLNVVHLPALRALTMTLVYIGAAFGIAFAVYDVYTRRFINALPGIGFCALIMFIAFDFMRYSASGFSSFQYTFMRGSWMTLGTLSFVVSVLINTFCQIPEYATKMAVLSLREEQKKLDYLTGVLLRDVCMAEIARLYIEEKEFSVTAIAIKAAGNDTPPFGTFEGDELLCVFVGFVRELFGGYGTIGRMAEAEFCCVCTGLTAEEIAEREAKLKDMLFTEMQKKPRMQYTVRTGFAFMDEETDGEKLYALAEDRTKRTQTPHPKR